MSDQRAEGAAESARQWFIDSWEKDARIRELEAEVERLKALLPPPEPEWVALKEGDRKPEGYQVRSRECKSWGDGIESGTRISRWEDDRMEYRAPKRGPETP